MPPLLAFYLAKGLPRWWGMPPWWRIAPTVALILLNFLASQVKDTRTPERFTAVGANAAKLDLDSKPVKEFIELLQKHHTTVDVTLATFESMFTGRPGVASPGPPLPQFDDLG